MIGKVNKTKVIILLILIRVGNETYLRTRVETFSRKCYN